MNQATTTQNNSALVNASFHAKSAGISLVVIMAIGIYYFVNMLELVPLDTSLPQGFLGLVLTTIIMMIVVETVLHIVLVIGAGQVSPTTQRDRTIALQATRNAYAVLALGVVMTFGSLFFAATPFIMGNILLLSFVLAEIAKFASELFYRRSAA